MGLGAAPEIQHMYQGKNGKGVLLALQALDTEAALAQHFKAYFELDRERPFFEALGEFRTHVAKCEEHVTTALSEVTQLLFS